MTTRCSLGRPNTGKKLVITADNNSKENRYIDNIRLNGSTYTKNFFSFADLHAGATVNYRMAAQPNKRRGTSEADQPYSFSNEKQ